MKYSVAHAKNNLSDLIDRALHGEGVVITRHGVPVVELRPTQPAAKPVTDADLLWLAERRLRPTRAPGQEAGELISRLRDEDTH